YVWSNGDTSSRIIVSPVVTTSYIVQPFGLYGCPGRSDTIKVYLNQGIHLNVMADQTTAWLGDTVLLTASGGNTYIWVNTSQTNDSIHVRPLTTTTYTVTAFKNHCNPITDT